MKTYFILPDRGGITLRINGQEIYTLSPESPLGQIIFGKLAGDSIELKIKGQARGYSIKTIR